MRSAHAATSSFTVLLVGALIACGDDAAGGGGAGASTSPSGSGAGQPTSATGTTTTTSGSGSGASTGSSMGPTRVVGDPARCPPGFETEMTPGQHGGWQSAGQDRSFHMLVGDGAGLKPLVVAFHGTGLSGEAVLDDYNLDAWAEAGAIVIAPDSNGNGSPWPVWDSVNFPGAPVDENPDLVYFDDLVACAAVHHEIDATRVYVLGHSAGGAMTDYMLGHRSQLLAGGIAASGAFDFTQPVPPEAVSPMTVIVTWGGDNDVYTGQAGMTFLENVSFAEQSSMASQYWEAQPGTHQVACEGANIGHQWLGSIGPWMRDFLLAHPKGSAVVPGEVLPALPGGAQATCFEEAATYTPPVMVDCPASNEAGCQAYCQMLGECMVENGTLGPVLADMLVAIGFADTPNVCSGCVDRCEEDAAGSVADATALDCIAQGATGITCGPGFAGAASVQVMGQCCAASPTAGVCTRFCDGWTANPVFNQLFPVCP